MCVVTTRIRASIVAGIAIRGRDELKRRGSDECARDILRIYSRHLLKSCSDSKRTERTLDSDFGFGPGVDSAAWSYSTFWT